MLVSGNEALVVASDGYEIVSHAEYPNEYRNNFDRNITISLGFDRLVKLRVVDFYIENEISGQSSSNICR